jgi:esterase/lipase superfamily enzyme
MRPNFFSEAYSFPRSIKMPKIIKVFFATNRNPVNNPTVIFGQDFRDNNPRRYVTGSINMVENHPGKPDSAWEPELGSLQLDPPKEATKKKAVGQVAGVQNDLVAFASERMPDAISVNTSADYGLILLPGFASTFINALQRAAQVADEYRSTGIFCFSWPANGRVNLKDYKADQVDAKKSAAAIADALLDLFRFLVSLKKAPKPILNIVAHSMGNYALSHAIQIVRDREPDKIKTDLFTGALLMAADEVDNGLSKADTLAPLVKLSRRVACYYAGGDGALTMSQLVNGNVRLGMVGPRNLINLSDKITSIDCSDVATTVDDKGGSHFRHQYYRLSPHVLRDVRQVLAEVPADQIEGRLAHISNPADGKGWWIPFDPNAAT